MGPTLELSPLVGGGGIKLAGEIDLANARQLTDALANISTDSEVHLELSELTFMDSSGLGAIVAFAGSRRAGCPVVLLNPSVGIKRLFEITCLEQHPTIEVRAVSKDGLPEKS